MESDRKLRVQNEESKRGTPTPCSFTETNMSKYLGKEVEMSEKLKRAESKLESVKKEERKIRHQHKTSKSITPTVKMTNYEPKPF